MDFVLKPSLEHIALVKIAVMIWNQNDVRVLIEKFDIGLLGYKEWQKIEDKVIEKVTQFPQLGIFTEKIMNIIKPIGLEIFKWVKDHCSYTSHFYLHIDLPSEFCWTPQGTIDRKKTAQALIEHENLDAINCYRLACIYCLQEKILELWNKLSKNHRNFVAEGKFSLMELYFYHYLILKWKLDTNFEREFEVFAFINKEVIEYFFNKLTLRQRKDDLVNTTKRVMNFDCVKADLLCFLLSQLNEEQQEKVFETHPYKMLQCFVDWPFQGFFINVANRTWNFLSKKDFNHLLKTIIDKIRDGYKDYDYINLFGKFWQESPNALKRYITEESTDGFLLSYLFQIKNKEIFKQLLQNFTIAEKMKLMYNNKLQNLCENFISDDEWDLLGFLIKECFQTKDEMMKFKQEFEEGMTQKSLKMYLSLSKRERSLLFHLPDDSDCKHNKRECTEEGESLSSKKFRMCSTQK